ADKAQETLVFDDAEFDYRSTGNQRSFLSDLRTGIKVNCIEIRDFPLLTTGTVKKAMFKPDFKKVLDAAMNLEIEKNVDYKFDPTAGFGFVINIMENPYMTKGKGLLMLHPDDYKIYHKDLKSNTCPKCGIVPAKSGGCINHEDCPMKPQKEPELSGHNPPTYRDQLIMIDKEYGCNSLYYAEKQQSKYINGIVQRYTTSKQLALWSCVDYHKTEQGNDYWNEIESKLKALENSN
ncbi:MAG TPA: hypothetical protein VN922_20635, partial [Bacteroidia bacterium]|nr:hypothetical protein [Bacteroidia bacterium]